LASLLDIVVPVNLLFLVGNLFLIAIVFSLTVALSRNSRRIRNLTQELALLKNETEQLEKKLSNVDTK
jgi:HAMP domain-containing protein